MVNLSDVDCSVYNTRMNPKRTSEWQALSARERILATACELFYVDGVRATGVDRLIADSGVTKVTFYRHFPSKNDLIRAFLDDRHERWMLWFTEALLRHRVVVGNGANALVPALREWFHHESYRGCAFINAVAEVGGVLPDVHAIAQQHKRAMTKVIAGLLPPSKRRQQVALALAVAIDGAIVRAQIEMSPTSGLNALKHLIRAITSHESL